MGGESSIGGESQTLLHHREEFKTIPQIGKEFQGTIIWHERTVTHVCLCSNQGMVLKFARKSEQSSESEQILKLSSKLVWKFQIQLHSIWHCEQQLS